LVAAIVLSRRARFSARADDVLVTYPAKLAQLADLKSVFSLSRSKSNAPVTMFAQKDFICGR
jgi:hypothetical protein